MIDSSSPAGIHPDTGTGRPKPNRGAAPTLARFQWPPTKKGLALQLILQGTKYYKDDRLKRDEP